MSGWDEDDIDKAIKVSIPWIVKVIRLVFAVIAKYKEVKAAAEETVRLREKAAKDRHNAANYEALRCAMRRDWLEWKAGQD